MCTLLLHLDLNYPTNDQAGNTPLILAVFRFPDDIIEENITSLNSSALVPYDTKKIITNTIFHALLEHKTVKLNNASFAGITALHAACRRGNAFIVMILLTMEGIDFNQKDHHGNTPLHAACAGGNDRIVALLIDAGANILETNKLMMHPFHVAVVDQSLEVIKMIQTHSRVAEVKNELLRAIDDDGNTMLLLAVKSGDVVTVKFLLENGADIKHKNKHGSNAFHLAATVNSADSCSIMEMIYASNAGDVQSLLDAKDMFFLTPLHYAARKNKKDVLSFLIEK